MDEYVNKKNSNDVCTYLSLLFVLYPCGYLENVKMNKHNLAVVMITVFSLVMKVSLF